MSVDMSLQVFVDTLELDALREVLEAKLADDDELAFVIARSAAPPGLWITVFDPTKGVNFYGLGAELSAKARCRAWELVNQEDLWTLTASSSGEALGESELPDESRDAALAQQLGGPVTLPSTWDGALAGCPSITLARGADWKRAARVLRPPKPVSKPKETEPRASGVAWLVEAWRETRAPELSEVIDRLSKVGKLPYPKSAKSDAKQARWLKMCEARSEDDLPALLSLLHDAYSTDVLARLAAIAKWPDDPRISSALARLFEQPSHFNVSALPFWEALGDLVVRYADPRTRARLDAVAALGAGWSSLFRPHMRGPIATLLDSVRARLVRAVIKRSYRVLTPAEQQRVAAERPPPSLDDALAAVWAAPDDLGRRLVYADMLTALGDPRGEFITLQCLDASTPEQRRRAAALARKHAEAWAGPIAPVVEVLAWERGFPAAVRVALTATRQLSAVLGHPAWSTVHTIEFETIGSGVPAELVVHPSMTRVLRVAGVSDTDVRALARRGGPFPFRSLVVHGVAPKIFKHLGEKVFPSLVQVQLTDEQALSRDAVEFMKARPGVDVVIGEFVLEKATPPTRLEPPEPKKVAKAAAKLDAASRKAQREKELESTAPTARELEKAFAARDGRSLGTLLDRAARAGDVALAGAAAQLFAAKLDVESLASALGPYLRALTLEPDRWVDLAEGGALLGNNAIADVAAANAKGASKKRLDKLARRATNERLYGRERLAALHERLA